MSGAGRITRTDSSSPEAVAQILRSYDNFFLDCDGTPYHGSALIQNVNETLQLLKTKGKRVYYMTNTSSRNSLQLKEKLNACGVEGVEEKACYPSGVYTAE